MSITHGIKITELTSTLMPTQNLSGLQVICGFAPSYIATEAVPPNTPILITNTNDVIKYLGYQDFDEDFDTTSWTLLTSIMDNLASGNAPLVAINGFKPNKHVEAGAELEILINPTSPSKLFFNIEEVMDLDAFMEQFSYTEAGNPVNVDTAIAGDDPINIDTILAITEPATDTCPRGTAGILMYEDDEGHAEAIELAENTHYILRFPDQAHKKQLELRFTPTGVVRCQGALHNRNLRLRVRQINNAGAHFNAHFEEADYRVSYEKAENGHQIRVTFTALGLNKINFDGNDGWAIKRTYTIPDMDRVDVGDLTEMVNTIDRVFTELQIVPSLLLCPGYSSVPNVALLLKTKCANLNDMFKCECIIDMLSANRFGNPLLGSIIATTVEEAKNRKADLLGADNANNQHVILTWPEVRFNTHIDFMSGHLGARIQSLDMANGNNPLVYPSNKPASITSCVIGNDNVILTKSQATSLEDYGFVTACSVFGLKWWGNNTAYYTSNMGSFDPKDRFIGIRRFFSWWSNKFITRYYSVLDGLMTKRVIENIIDEINFEGNQYVANGYCASCRMVYLDSENNIEDLINGKVVFHMYLAPYTPLQEIHVMVEFSASDLTAQFQNING